MEACWKFIAIFFLSIFSVLGIRWLFFQQAKAKYHYLKLNKLAKSYNILTVKEAHNVLDNVQNFLIVFEQRK